MTSKIIFMRTRSAIYLSFPTDMTGKGTITYTYDAGKTGGKKIGPSLILRVMAGDSVQISARAFYKSEGPKDNGKQAPVEDMVAGLVQAFGGSTSEGASHAATDMSNGTLFNADFYGNTYQRLKEKNTDNGQSDRPKAYLNFVLFDDDFKLVEDNSGVRQVKSSPDELQELGVEKMGVAKSGYLYVYTSNESQQDVYFDNVVFGLGSGPLLEETHYYPYGLTMGGSTNALKGVKYPENRMKYNRKELQSKEFADGGGLELSEGKAKDDKSARFTKPSPMVVKPGQNVIKKPDFLAPLYGR
jgi:hypothetical protein